MQALKDGIPAHMVKDDLERVAQRQEELKTVKNTDQAEKPLIHPAMSNHYRKIVLTPQNGRDTLQIDLYGDLVGILSLAAGDKNRLKPASFMTLEQLPAANGNTKQGANKVGSGGAIPPLFACLITALNIG